MHREGEGDQDRTIQDMHTSKHVKIKSPDSIRDNKMAI